MSESAVKSSESVKNVPEFVINKTDPNAPHAEQMMNTSESVIYKTATSKTPDLLLQDALNIKFSSPDDLASRPSIMTDRYDFVSKIGKGSQGQVWLATRKSDGEKVAIKQFNIHSVTTWKQYELFRREAQVLESIHIDGVVPFYEYVEDLKGEPPYVCIVQKYIEGKTVAEYRRLKHRFEAEAIYDIIAQVLKILQLLHEHKPQVIHRDIKPSNLMLTPIGDGRFKVTLLDFGAVANPQVQTGGSTVAGTFGYMPPEQLMGRVGPASDIYALASVAVELLSGVSPADIEVCDFKLVIEPYLQHLPDEVVQTLNMMLEPALENRICDYNILTAQFTELAEKKKTSFLSRLRRTAVPELADVESICQAGNYEIWQNIDLDIAVPIIQQKLEKGAQEKAKTKLNYSRMLFIGPILNAIILITVLLTINFAIPDAFLEQYELFFWPVVLPMAGLALWSLSRIKPRFNYYKSLKRLNGLIGTVQNARPSVNLTLKEIAQLLNSGQRVVGRIMSIQFEPIPYSAIRGSHPTYSPAMGEPITFARPYRSRPYWQTNAEFDAGLRVKDFNLFGLCEPRFHIIYTFQLKFNDILYDFTGELVTQVPPEDHYKIGDPLTLIAQYTSDGSTRHKLEVMPYPYPYEDIAYLDDLIFKQHIPNDISNLPDSASRYEAVKTTVQNTCSSHSLLDLLPLMFTLWFPKSKDTLDELCYEIGERYRVLFERKKEYNTEEAVPLVEKALQNYYTALSLGNSAGYCNIGRAILNNDLPQISYLPMDTDFTSKQHAYAYFKAAFDFGCPQAGLDLGNILLDENQKKPAVEWYEKAAHAGNIEATMKAAKLHAKEKFVSDALQRAQKIISLYEIAAKQAHAPAMLELGNLYKDLEDNDMAMVWYAKEKTIESKSNVLKRMLETIYIQASSIKDQTLTHGAISVALNNDPQFLKQSFSKDTVWFIDVSHFLKIMFIIHYHQYTNALKYINKVAEYTLSNAKLIIHKMNGNPRAQLKLYADVTEGNPEIRRTILVLHSLFEKLPHDSEKANYRITEILYELSAQFKDEDAAAGLNKLGIELVKYQAYEDAERVFQKAVKYGNKDAVLQIIYLARVYRISNESIEASLSLLEDYKSKDIAILLLDIGDIYWEKFDDYEKAEALYRKALEFGATAAGCRLIDLGTKYITDLKDKSKARDLYITVAAHWHLKKLLETIETSEKKIKTIELSAMILRGNQKHYVELADIYRFQLNNIEKAHKYYLFVDEWMRQEGSRTEKENLKSSFDYSGFNTMLDNKISSLGNYFRFELNDIDTALNLFIKASDAKALTALAIDQDEKKNYHIAKIAYENAIFFGDDSARNPFLALGDRFVYELKSYEIAKQIYEKAGQMGDKLASAHLIMLAGLYETLNITPNHANEIKQLAWDLLQIQDEHQINTLDQGSITRKLYDELIALGINYTWSENIDLAQKARQLAIDHGAKPFETEHLDKRIADLKADHSKTAASEKANATNYTITWSDTPNT